MKQTDTNKDSLKKTRSRWDEIGYSSIHFCDVGLGNISKNASRNLFESNGQRCEFETIRTGYNNYLMHYGVRGMKWGVRRYVDKNGYWTAEAKARYRAEHPESRQQSVNHPSKTPSTDQVRRSQAKRIIGITAGVTLAAVAGYAAYKGSTKLRDKDREAILKNFTMNGNKITTLNGQYWNSSDRKEYERLTKERGKYLASNYTRRDAVLTKFSEKTGIRLSAPQSRSKIIESRKNENDYANFIRDAEKRASTNKSIHNARERVREAQKDLDQFNQRERIGTSKQYEGLWRKKKEEALSEAKGDLKKLLQSRGGV